jgi:hypothetical protein
MAIGYTFLLSEEGLRVLIWSRDIYFAYAY